MIINYTVICLNQLGTKFLLFKKIIKILCYSQILNNETPVIKQ